MRKDSPKTSIREPPRRLARYMAASALARRVPPWSTPKVLRATPTDTSRKSSAPSITNGRDNASLALSIKANASFWAWPDGFWTKTRNSSPPSRATSSSPATVLNRWATAHSTRSPASWPKLLLTSLNRSRSRGRRPPFRRLLRPGVAASLRRRENWSRSGSPVSGSCPTATEPAATPGEPGTRDLNGSGSMNPATERWWPWPNVTRMPSTATLRPLLWASTSWHLSPDGSPAGVASPPWPSPAGGGSERPKVSTSPLLAGDRTRSGGRSVSAIERPTTSCRRQPNSSSARGFHSMTTPRRSTSRKPLGHDAARSDHEGVTVDWRSLGVKSGDFVAPRSAGLGQVLPTTLTRKGDAIVRGTTRTDRA